MSEKVIIFWRNEQNGETGHGQALYDLETAVKFINECVVYRDLYYYWIESTDGKTLWSDALVYG